MQNHSLQSYFPFLLVLLAVGLAVNVFSQEISTIAEINNYDEGDIFHTRFYEEIDDYWWEKIYSKTVIDKYYSQDNDTVFYTFDVIKMERETYPPDWEWSYYTVTYHYTNLDSLINDGNIDTVYTDEELYNGRDINFYEVDNPPNTNNRWKYVKGCGRAYHTYHGYGFGFSISEIVYYNKSGEEWGEPLLILGLNEINDQPEILIYPNPVRDNLNIKVYEMEVEKAEIYTLNGNKIASQRIRASTFSLDVSDLLPGIYIVKLYKQENVFTEIFVKE